MGWIRGEGSQMNFNLIVFADGAWEGWKGSNFLATVFSRILFLEASTMERIWKLINGNGG